jgi:hypothetical protein
MLIYEAQPLIIPRRFYDIPSTENMIAARKITFIGKVIWRPIYFDQQIYVNKLL